MNILFTVCGRGGSKGVANKNFRPFLGVPLYVHTLNGIRLYIERYQSEDERYDIALSTDSSYFINLVTGENDIIIRERPECLAQDATPKMPAILDAAEYASIRTGFKYDYVIDLDITSPIRTIDEIRGAYEKKLARQDTDVVFSVVSARRSPYFNMVKEDGASFTRVIPAAFTARQQAPQLYDLNASIYVYEYSFLKSGAISPLDGRADIFQMRDTGIIDIDSEEDFELMELIAKHMSNKDERYSTIFGMGRSDT